MLPGHLRRAAPLACALLLLGSVGPRLELRAAGPSPADEIERLAKSVEPRVVAWRRDLHQNPELGNHEVRTSALVADHLKKLGLEVRTGIAHTGVVGILRGGQPGRVVALRADMDALPVTEQVDLPFASRARATWNGREVGVMHACGHDAHVAMLMGAAEVLAGFRAQIPGTILFVFQPAEEGGPEGETSGAELMLKEGAFADPKPDAVFGLHVFPFQLGGIQVKPGAMMASGDTLHITIKGRQTHGAVPWAGVDPIVVASQVVLGLQTIVSRQVDISRAPVVVTVGRIAGGVRSNIVPDLVEMEGTIRTFDDAIKEDVHRRVKRTAESIAEASGAEAVVRIERGYPVTANDPALTERMLPTLKRVAGAANVVTAIPTGTSEDFSFFAKAVPGMFLFLGVTPPGQDPATVASNHSPKFFVDERALPVGVRTLASLAYDFLASPPAAGSR